ncbi:MAG TPA: hypothetical protein VLE19_14810 [Pyrinomonadaceae bacterium]|nr:hypothetical protein [Pyrinomonadaceae bacterium]
MLRPQLIQVKIGQTGHRLDGPDQPVEGGGEIGVGTSQGRAVSSSKYARLGRVPNFCSEIQSGDLANQTRFNTPKPAENWFGLTKATPEPTLLWS